MNSAIAQLLDETRGLPRCHLIAGPPHRRDAVGNTSQPRPKPRAR